MQITVVLTVVDEDDFTRASFDVEQILSKNNSTKIYIDEIHPGKLV